jgi:hypothetical protein
MQLTTMEDPVNEEFPEEESDEAEPPVQRDPPVPYQFLP